MSKESKIAKKEAKAEKKASKAAKKNTKNYNKLVEKINKKNTKLEKKCAKKNKPFVPIAIPEEGEVVTTKNTGKNIFKLILLILLIWFFIYFIIMWVNYVAPAITAEEDTTTSSEAVAGDVSLYDNQHEITTTPTYSIADAKLLLKQTVHDNWQSLGYSSDPSSGSISFTNSTVKVNNDPCYVFSVGNKTYYVSVKLRGVYYQSNGEYVAIQNNGTEYLNY